MVTKLVFYCEPVDAPKSGTFGQVEGYGFPHRGIDYAIASGNLFRAPAPGIVVPFTNDGTFGRYAICLEHDHVPDEFRFSLYAHGSASYVQLGQRVEAGEHLGLTGNEGKFPGQYADHLHLQLSDSPSFPLDISHSTDPMALVLTEEEMDRLQTLEKDMASVRKLLGENGVDAVCYPGTEKCFPDGTPVVQEGEARDTDVILLLGEKAFEYCVLREFSFPLGLRRTQIAQRKVIDKIGGIE